MKTTLNYSTKSVSPTLAHWAIFETVSVKQTHVTLVLFHQKIILTSEELGENSSKCDIKHNLNLLSKG